MKGHKEPIQKYIQKPPKIYHKDVLLYLKNLGLQSTKRLILGVDTTIIYKSGANQRFEIYWKNCI